MVALTDHQLRIVVGHAGAMPVDCRSRFLEQFVVELRRNPRHDDDAVSRAAQRAALLIIGQPAA